MKMETEYTFVDGESGHHELRLSSHENIESDLSDWVRESDYYESESTFWISATAWPVSAEDEDGDVEYEHITSVTVALHPKEPPCIRTRIEHVWRSPIELVGGIKENPGVWGHGGGVVIHEACIACGYERVTDTWAQNRSNGVQGLESITYEPDAHDVNLCETCSSYGTDTLAVTTAGRIVTDSVGVLACDTDDEMAVCWDCAAQVLPYPSLKRTVVA